MRDRFLRGEEFFHADDMKEVERLDGTGEDYQIFLRVLMSAKPLVFLG